MYYLIDSMSRISETIGLHHSDIDLDPKIVTIPATIAKSRKARTIPLQPVTARLLMELIAENRAEFDSEYIFLTNYGERVSRDLFRNKLNEYAKIAGITKMFIRAYSGILLRQCSLNQAEIFGIYSVLVRALIYGWFYGIRTYRRNS